MKPAFSVIFFTVMSGAGLGLMVWLLVATMMSAHIRMPNVTFINGVIIAAAFIVVGLCSSTLHLANRKNVIYSLTQFRTSWLSREGVFALALFPIAGLYLWLRSAAAPTVVVHGLALVLIALAIIILFCTGMIYGCLKTIPRWNSWLTPTKYVLFGLMSGALLFVAILSTRSTEIGPLGRPWVAIVLLAAGLLVYLGYLLKHPRKQHTINDALGLKQGQVRLLDVGHTHGTFLTNEFGFQLAREKARLLRWLSIALGFVLPLVLLFFSNTPPFAPVVACLIGLFVERWLFFAEAEHVVRLYHGQQHV
ncbi:MAG: DMSO reductase [Betaproteobacteria bacterium]|nr:MAG: DMSO reductase [Betaproteobacteria bacterium]